MRRPALSATLAFVLGTFTLPAALSAQDIVPPDSKLELLYTRTAPINGGLTEGIAAAPDGSMYFSEIPFGSDKGMIMRFDPKTKKTTVFAQDSHKSNGLMFDAHGNLLACEGSDGGGRCLAMWDVKTGTRKVVADKYQGKRFNACNDLCIDEKGRVYFTDPRYLGTETRELEHRAVYRADFGYLVRYEGGQAKAVRQDGDPQIVEVTHDIEKPNGIAISPDQKTLYVADHNNGTDRIDPTAPKPKRGAMKVYAFPLGSDGLVSGPKRTFIDFAPDDGSDGMTVDTEGRVYLACRKESGPGIMVLEPSGRQVAFIKTGEPHTGAGDPVGLPSNCDFGIGDEKNVLYLTVDKSVFRIKLNATGYHIPWAKQKEAPAPARSGRRKDL